MKTLYLSLGPTCKPVYYLDESKLRSFSSPMDWLAYQFDTVIKFYKSDFDSFLDEYEEMESDPEYEFRKIYDTKNNVLVMHSISKNLKLEDGVNSYLKKVDKRWKRLQKKIEENDVIVFLSAYQYDFEKLKKSIDELETIFNNKKLVIVNVYNCPEEKKLIHRINSKKTIVEYFFEDDSEKDWKGNKKGWDNVIQDLHLDNYFSEKSENKELYMCTIEK